jgi:succinoglycan biosynthesis transport protein ExoP
MSILQFIRIIWAYRILILLSTAVALVAAALVVQLVTPRYEAQSRVMLDVIKPDPVTGQVMSTAFLRAYTKTQIELVKDQQVARRVVEDLNWAKNPSKLKAYRERDDGADLDFNRWAAMKVAEGANASLISGSNILEITYSSPSPEEAKIVADALRKGYVEMTLNSRREAARRNAQWYEEQAEKSKGVLFKAEADKAAYERANGILLQDDKSDVEAARLQALAMQASAPVMAAPAQGASPSAAALAQLDAEIAEAQRSLGPNHPALVQARTRRQLLANQVAQERNTMSAAAGAAMSAARATTGMLEQQKAKVMAQREKVERARLMQDEIDLRRDQYNKAMARAAQLRQEAEVLEAGVVPLAAAATPQMPVFPKRGLTIGASIPLGAAFGIVLALLLEMVGRRIRSASDLASVVQAPVLAVLQDPKARKRAGWRHRLGWVIPSRGVLSPIARA